MIAINGQEAIVKALGGVYLKGLPWEESAAVLQDVQEEVEAILETERPSWMKILLHCKRFAEAGFLEDIEVKQYLTKLQERPEFARVWQTYVSKRSP